MIDNEDNENSSNRSSSNNELDDIDDNESNHTDLAENNLLHAERAHGLITRVNDYKVLSVLGSGSYGKVYLVQKDYDSISFSYDTDQETSLKEKSIDSLTTNSNISSNRYAMKVIINQKKNNFNSRYFNKINDEDVILKEIAIMKSLNHPNLVHLLEVIRETEEPHTIFMVMEYVDFGTIMKKSVNEDENLSGIGSNPMFYCPLTKNVMGEAFASKSFRSIISAMKYLHAHHIAHRDLKIDNILLDHDGNVRIADFGVSHVFRNDDDDGQVNDAVGTWAYWAPEMCDDSDSVSTYDAYKADVWAAGVCLWVMIFGYLPFWGNTLGELFSNIMKGKPTYPSVRSKELMDLLDNLLNMNPLNRFSFSDAINSNWITQHYLIDDSIKSNKRRHSDVYFTSPIDVSSAITRGNVQFSQHIESKLHKWSEIARQHSKERHDHIVNHHEIVLRKSILELEYKLGSDSNDESDDDDFFSTSRTAKTLTSMKSANKAGCNCIIN